MPKLRSHKRQRGFANIVIMIVGLSVLTMLIMHWQQRSKIMRIQAQVTPFYQNLEYITKQVNAFQIDQIAQGWPPSSAAVFPNTWSDLQPAYLPNCSTTDNNAGKCRKPEQTPWGTSMLMTKINSPVPPSVTPRYRLQIQIPFPNATSDATRLEHQAVLETLSRFPGSEFNETSNSLFVWVDRIDSGVQQDALVKRSGDDSTLTGDWDVGGNYAITNAKDVTIRNSDGSQRSVGTGVVRAFVGKHNERVSKHKCPANLTPSIIVSIKSIFAQNNANNINTISQSKTYATENSTYWTLGLDYYAQLQGSSTWTLQHDGEISAFLICKN
ncbi:hypothetical protein OCF84_22065 (plasmid) [Shewanella xiamenensis]|uniref:hypothetical protein n=1 Tax=Shewanella xiamenensis TaxID=332186 RepID=UPI0024AD3317|nr:hypothetical protein [Shewanella xiamenensis]WHF58030.1 hypothetical protein OCF84_22065 [Shewanella xiamenensis]